MLNFLQILKNIFHQYTPEKVIGCIFISRIPQLVRQHFYIEALLWFQNMCILQMGQHNLKYCPDKWPANPNWHCFLVGHYYPIYTVIIPITNQMYATWEKSMANTLTYHAHMAERNIHWFPSVNSLAPSRWENKFKSVVFNHTSLIDVLSNSYDIALRCWIWSWSPMPCEKHGPRDSVDKNRGRRPSFCRYWDLRAMSFYRAWETMIKSY